MQAEIACLSDAGVPRSLTEIVTLGRTLKRRSGDILAYFDYPHTSNGPTEAINGRLEHLRGSALGFRNLTNYITRCLLETGGFKPQLHPQLGRAVKGRFPVNAAVVVDLVGDLARDPDGFALKCLGLIIKWNEQVPEFARKLLPAL